MARLTNSLGNRRVSDAPHCDARYQPSILSALLSSVRAQAHKLSGATETAVRLRLLGRQ
jgi:hypothetical protein